MQASAAPPRDATVIAVAERLLAAWQWLTASAGTELTLLLEDLDLSLHQLKMLETLAALGEEAPSVKDVSERLGCSLANSSRGVDALVRRGLLERREDEHDRRVKRIGVTRRGREALARVDAVRLAALERFAAGLGAEQRDLLLRALGDLPANDPRPREAAR
jgi:DNA-binding MarR family transcriptional regulator